MLVILKYLNCKSYATTAYPEPYCLVHCMLERTIGHNVCHLFFFNFNLWLTLCMTVYYKVSKSTGCVFYSNMNFVQRLQPIPLLCIDIHPSWKIKQHQNQMSSIFTVEAFLHKEVGTWFTNRGLKRTPKRMNNLARKQWWLSITKGSF